MKIGELARTAGVDVETIRYYERIKLMPVPKRQRNGYRAYSERHVEQLAFIRHCRALDMRLPDIRRLLDFIAQPADRIWVDRALNVYLDRQRARLRSLRALEKQLTALRAQCALANRRRGCGIHHELVAAARAEARERRPGHSFARTNRD